MQGESNITRKRDKNYLVYLRGLPCLIDGRLTGCIEAHHLRVNTDGGMALKPSDYYAVPLCHRCHIEQLHRHGERSFWRNNGWEIEEIKEYAKKLYENYKKGLTS